MNNEYIIINRTALKKRIEELEKEYILLSNKSDRSLSDIEKEREIVSEQRVLATILSQSTPLIPEIEKAIQFGKDVRTEKSFINDDYESPFIDYQDSTEETNDYITNLKLDI